MDSKETNAPPERTAIPPMLEEMMETMCRGGGCSPASMCQEMMGTSGAAAYTRPEAQTAFNEWAHAVEDEILAALRARSPLDLATLAGTLRTSPESTLYFVGTLLRDGKATISSLRSTGTTDETA